jgi:hypothetical protein
MVGHDVFPHRLLGSIGSRAGRLASLANPARRRERGVLFDPPLHTLLNLSTGPVLLLDQ